MKEERIIYEEADRCCSHISEEVTELISTQEIADLVVRKLISTGTEAPEFAHGNIPVKTAAKILGKAPCWVQAGIIAGWFPVGFATLDGEIVRSLNEIKPNRRIDYTIIPKKFWEVTGYVWRG